jgi:hypothetical protein
MENGNRKGFCYGCNFPPTWGKFNIPHHIFSKLSPFFLLVSKFKFIFAAGL